MKSKAVILGANYYIGLSIIRCLGIHDIPVVAVDYSTKGSYALHSKYCTETLIGPHYKKDSTGFLNFLIDYGKKQDSPPVLFPGADPYVEFIDEHLNILKEYYLIPQTEQGLYTKVMNKETLHALAEKHGMLVPETLRPNEENFLQKVEEIIKFPCLVKPTDSPAFVSKFRKKLFKVYTMEELQSSLQLAQDANLEVIVQRIIPGFDDHMYTFDAYLNQDAKVTHWMTCQKFRQYPINFGASVYTGQRHVPELYDIGAKFLEDIGFKGFAEIEFKKDAETGKFYLIEINVRTTNLNSLLDKAGINMPYLGYSELTGHPVKPYAITQDTNLVFWYAFEDFLAVKNYLETGQLKFGQVLKSYFQPKAYAIWDWKDPKPGFVFLGDLFGRGFRKIFKTKG
ncbi:carboxylate--amine ligase [Irregularibacter muris]|uniref:Carboxylate--amine ligase n=1 Tax=Irregularibacter muris TaxID=1796619 RepID=A0AAE3HH25_9FIRM|nr:carboxylate--amine ligase [Irregularibacter muris]MCR1899304.1 carboxylate--amine ligase [Irregularibacter muris]